VVVTGTIVVSEISKITGGLISEITGEPGPKRSRRKMPVDQKGSWSPGPVGDPEYTTIKSPEEFAHIKRLSESG
jgi:hypothetical protein